MRRVRWWRILKGEEKRGGIAARAVDLGSRAVVREPRCGKRAKPYL